METSPSLHIYFAESYIYVLHMCIFSLNVKKRNKKNVNVYGKTTLNHRINSIANGCGEVPCIMYMLKRRANKKILISTSTV